MNLGALIGFTRTFVRQDLKSPNAPNDGEIIDFLNQANFDTAHKLRIPLKQLSVTSQTSPFSLPADAWSTDPLVSVQYEPDSSETFNLPIVSIDNANLRYPNWHQDTSTDDPEIAIFTGGVNSQPDVYVYPNPGAADYEVLYHVKPTAMRAFTDSPFNGEFDDHHFMLAHLAAFYFSGSPQRYALYQSMLSDAAGHRRRGPKIQRNLHYKMNGRYYY